MLPMAIASSGTVRAALTQNRRLISRSSGFSSSPRVTVRGSSAMPQMGQLPGPGRTISGCIGQVHSVLVAGSCGDSGSNAIPHFGHGPGPSCLTSAHIGQTWIRSPLFPAPSVGPVDLTGASPIPCPDPSDTSPDPIGVGGEERIFSGFALNFAKHPGEQKKYSLPRYVNLSLAVAGSTFIPQTGSVTLTPSD